MSSADFRGETLVQVVLGPPERQQGIRLTCLELYADGVVVRWHQVSHPSDPGDGQLDEMGDPSMSLLAFPDFFLADDCGTRYTPVESGSGGDGMANAIYVAWGEAILTPGVPSNARELRVFADDTVFHVPVGSGDAGVE